MSSSLTLKIDSDLESVELIAKAIRALCSDKLSEEALNDVELGVVEAINNVIKHGYGGSKGSSIEVGVAFRSDRVTIDIIDQAAPMPEGTLSHQAGLFPEVDPDQLDSLPESGMGLSLIQMTMDEVSYSSKGGINQLTLSKLFISN